jgi:hypothetical protein
MKKCPACGAIYSIDMNYCLADGRILAVEGALDEPGSPVREIPVSSQPTAGSPSFPSTGIGSPPSSFGGLDKLDPSRLKKFFHRIIGKDD